MHWRFFLRPFVVTAAWLAGFIVAPTNGVALLIGIAGLVCLGVLIWHDGEIEEHIEAHGWSGAYCPQRPWGEAVMPRTARCSHRAQPASGGMQRRGCRG